jgi:hypothetical protein
MDCQSTGTKPDRALSSAGTEPSLEKEQDGEGTQPHT